jgi:hypothetical protein
MKRQSGKRIRIQGYLLARGRGRAMDFSALSVVRVLHVVVYL